MEYWAQRGMSINSIELSILLWFYF